MGLLQIVYREAKRGLESGSVSTIPVLVKASDIAREKPANLITYLEESSRKLSLQKKAVFGLVDLNAGRVCLFVDALDEVGDTRERQRVAHLVDEFASAYPKCLVVISSRPYEYLAEIDVFEKYVRFFVVPIKWKDAERILDLVRTNKTVSDAKVKESLQQLATVQGFDLSPLMVSVYAVTATFEAKDIPPNVTELFKRFSEQMLGRWDEQKGLRNLHRPLIKDFALCALAFHMHQARLTKLSRVDARNIIRDQLRETGHLEDAASILDETINRSGLFRDFGEEIGFRHHMFQEFFAGRAISSSDFVAANMADTWWRRPIVFYFGDRPKSAHELDVTVGSIGQLADAKRYSAYCTIGLALQACYLSSVATKIDVWKRVTGGLASLANSFYEANDPANLSPVLTSLAYAILTRHSVSLSHIADAERELRGWIEAWSGDQEELFAFFIVALIRIGRFDLITNADATRFCQKTARQILLLCETAEATYHRPLDKMQVSEVERIGRIADKGTRELFKVLVKELDSKLEVRKLIEDKVADKRKRDAEGIDAQSWRLGRVGTIEDRP